MVRRQIRAKGGEVKKILSKVIRFGLPALGVVTFITFFWMIQFFFIAPMLEFDKPLWETASILTAMIFGCAAVTIVIVASLVIGVMKLQEWAQRNK
jgi:hypothetical protein